MLQFSFLTWLPCRRPRGPPGSDTLLNDGNGTAPAAEPAIEERDEANRPSATPGAAAVVPERIVWPDDYSDDETDDEEDGGYANREEEARPYEPIVWPDDWDDSDLEDEAYASDGSTAMEDDLASLKTFSSIDGSDEFESFSEIVVAPLN
mmetsp:Transcript_6231/g.17203  ORF Transcript_6231/g.17203 Transcript_6231/m.17203 type:complete len:150 (+) Transcript_6231:29-478(+)